MMNAVYVMEMVFQRVSVIAKGIQKIVLGNVVVMQQRIVLDNVVEMRQQVVVMRLADLHQNLMNAVYVAVMVQQMDIATALGIQKIVLGYVAEIQLLMIAVYVEVKEKHLIVVALTYQLDIVDVAMK